MFGLQSQTDAQQCGWTAEGVVKSGGWLHALNIGFMFLTPSPLLLRALVPHPEDRGLWDQQWFSRYVRLVEMLEPGNMPSLAYDTVVGDGLDAPGATWESVRTELAPAGRTLEHVASCTKRIRIRVLSTLFFQTAGFAWTKNKMPLSVHLRSEGGGLVPTGDKSLARLPADERNLARPPVVPTMLHMTGHGPLSKPELVQEALRVYRLSGAEVIESLTAAH